MWKTPYLQQESPRKHNARASLKKAHVAPETENIMATVTNMEADSNYLEGVVHFKVDTDLLSSGF